MASEFDDGLPVVGSDASGARVAGPHPDTSAFDIGLPATAQPPPKQPTSLTGTSWQKIVGAAVPFASSGFVPGLPDAATTPEMVTGLVHGIREGIIDKPALGLANAWDWLTGGNQSDIVRKQNETAAAAGREAGSSDPAGYEGGKLAGHVGSQMAVAGPVLRAIGAGLEFIPGIGRLAPWITGTAGETMPGLPGTIMRTGAGTTSGATAGGLTALLSGEDPIKGAAEGGMLGGGLSLGLQGLARSLQTLRGTYVPPEVRTPGGNWQASAETAGRARDAQILLDHGVPVTTRQVSGDPVLKVTDAPWSGASGNLANQQEAFRRAALGHVTGDARAGANEAAPSLADDAFVQLHGDRIGNNFQGVANRNNIDVANNLAPQLNAFSRRLTGIDEDTQRALAPYLRTVERSMTRDPATGQVTISGSKYLDLTNSKSDLQKLAGTDGLPAQYAQELINILHNGLSASASSADQAVLAAARQQYRALKAVEAARGAGGAFEPKDLFSAIEAQSKRYGGSSGTVDPLAKAGTTVLQPSYGGGGTAGGVAATAVPTGLAAVPGLAMGTMGTTGLLGTLGAAALPAGVAGIGLPPLLEAVNRNPANLARALELLRNGANYAPYRAVAPVIPPAVAATQQ